MKTPIRILITTLLGGMTLLPASAAERARVHLLPEQPILRLGEQQRTFLNISIQADELPPAAERAPVNLALVIDTSSSMQGARIKNVRLAAAELIARLDRNDLFSLVVYNSSAKTLVPAGPVEDKAALQRIVANLEASGMTALHAGVSEGAKQLARHANGPYTHRMILISDGVANVGPSRPDQIAELGSRIGQKNIRISTIGLGLNYNEDLMTTLADSSGGNAYFAESGPDLPGIIDREIGQALALVYESIQIFIRFPAGVRPLRSLTPHVSINRQDLRAQLPPLYSGQVRDLLVEVEIDASVAQESVVIPPASFSVSRPATNALTSLTTAPTTLRFSSNPRVAESSINQSIQTQRLRDEAAIARSEALRMQTAGDSVGASALLAETSRRIQEAPAARDNRALDEEAGSLQSQSKLIKDGQLDRRERIVMRSSSFEQLNRQKHSEE